MIAIVPGIIFLLAAAVAVRSTPLDDYVWKHDENFNWVDLVSFYLR